MNDSMFQICYDKRILDEWLYVKYHFYKRLNVESHHDKFLFDTWLYVELCYDEFL